MSFDRKLESYNLSIFFYLNIWQRRDSQCFTCHLMASLNEYVNVAFSLRISSCEIENNYKREPLGQLMLYYLSRSYQNMHTVIQNKGIYTQSSLIYIIYEKYVLKERKYFILFILIFSLKCRNYFVKQMINVIIMNVIGKEYIKEA